MSDTENPEKTMSIVDTNITTPIVIETEHMEKDVTTEIMLDDVHNPSTNNSPNKSQTQLMSTEAYDPSTLSKENTISESNGNADMFKQPAEKDSPSNCTEKENLPCPLDYNVTTPDINEVCYMIDTEIKSEVIDKMNENPCTINIPSVEPEENELEADLNDTINMEESIPKTFKRVLPDLQSHKSAKRRRLKMPKYKLGKIESFGYGEKGDKCICLSNLPCSWDDMKVFKFIENLEKECDSIKSHEILDDVASNNKNRVVLLRFDSSKKCLNALCLFKNKMVEGGVIHVFRGKEELFKEEHRLAISGEVKTDTEPRTTDIKKQQQKMRRVKQNVVKKMDIWDDDPSGLYGLSEEFLKEHDIRPPLTHWVHVRNFQFDKSQLKEMMGLAGEVLFSHVVRTKTGYAKVRFSHPIEAAQAVSMLNGQIMHGRVLNVCIDPGPHNTPLLPPGLTKVGPGFGPGGSPMRDIVKQYERHLDGKKTEINGEIFGINSHKIVQLSMDDEKRILCLVKELKNMGITTEYIIEHLKALKAVNTIKDAKKSIAEKPDSVKQIPDNIKDTNDSNNATTTKDIEAVPETNIEITNTNVHIDNKQDTTSNDASTPQIIPPKGSPNSKSQNSPKSGQVTPPRTSPNPSWSRNNAGNNFGRPNNNFQRGSSENPNFRTGNPSPGFRPNVQNNSSFIAPRSFGPSVMPRSFGFSSGSGPGVAIRMGPPAPFVPHVTTNRPFSTSGPSPGPSPWGPVGTFGPNVMGPRPSLLGTGIRPCQNMMMPGMGPNPNVLGPRPNAMGPGPNAMGPRPNAMGPRPTAMGPGPNAMGPRSNAMGPGPNALGPGPNAMGPGPNAMGPRPNSMGPGPIALGPGPNTMGPGQKSPMNNSFQSVVVSVNNLPASVTSGLLHDKMSECGEVHDITNINNGYALVRFSTEWEADRCVKTYNNTCVDGNRIEVKRYLS